MKWLSHSFSPCDFKALSSHIVTGAWIHSSTTSFIFMLNVQARERNIVVNFLYSALLIWINNVACDQRNYEHQCDFSTSSSIRCQVILQIMCRLDYGTRRHNVVNYLGPSLLDDPFPGPFSLHPSNLILSSLVLSPNLSSNCFAAVPVSSFHERVPGQCLLRDVPRWLAHSVAYPPHFLLLMYNVTPHW